MFGSARVLVAFIAVAAVALSLFIAQGGQALSHSSQFPLATEILMETASVSHDGRHEQSSHDHPAGWHERHHHSSSEDHSHGYGLTASQQLAFLLTGQRGQHPANAVGLGKAQYELKRPPRIPA
ncbi:hypothetical protein [Pelagibacterium sp.]|uniref:hypothetical protein n=1 Tax=Pelagibacterium sp. TaxID=1967288 RepID=UPI003BA96570